MLSLNIPSYALDYTSQWPLSLSSRNINVCAQFPDRMKYSSKPTPRPDSSRNRGQAISPLQHRHAEQDRRRTDFLRKVRQAGEDQKWRSRGDQILREDYISRQKQWEEEQAKSAPEMPMAPEAEENEVRQEDRTKVAGEGTEIMEDILQHESQEFDTLISRLDESNSSAMEQKETETTENYGSDDEEYDWLCMEAVSAIEAKGDGAHCQDMDMSSG